MNLTDVRRYLDSLSDDIRRLQASAKELARLQDDLARILLQLAGVDQPPYELTPEEAADLDASLAEAAGRVLARAGRARAAPMANATRACSGSLRVTMVRRLSPACAA